MPARYTVSVGLAIMLLPLVTAGPSAHEGEDHGAAPPPIGTAVSPRLNAASETFELVAVARHGELIIYLDRYRTNEPIEGATIEVETPSGASTATARPDATYAMAADWTRRPGRYDLIFAVTADGSADVLTGTLVVPEATTPAAAQTFWLVSLAFAEEVGHKLASNGVILALGLGFIAGAGLMFALFRRRPSAAATVLAIAAVLAGIPAARGHEGHDEAGAKPAAQGADLAQRLPGGGVFVPKPTQRILGIRTIVTAAANHPRTLELPGRIVPDPNASGYVQASVSGRLSPPPGGFPRLGTSLTKGDIVAYLTPPLQAIDVSDMRQRQGELDQQINLVEARIARYERLAQSGAVARVQLDEARVELGGLRERRAALDHVRSEPEPLVAPVSGVVAAVNAVAGQIAQPNTVVFHIVDPSRLWVEALSFEAFGRAHDPHGRTADGRSLTLSYQGAGLTDRNQAIPVHFAIEGDTRNLRIGQLVTVLAHTDETKAGIGLPRTSVLRGANGQAIVYQHTEAERFEPREIRSEPLDGERIVATAGVGAGARVVTQGAELLNQMR